MQQQGFKGGRATLDGQKRREDRKRRGASSSSSFLVVEPLSLNGKKKSSRTRLDREDEEGAAELTGEMKKGAPRSYLCQFQNAFSRAAAAFNGVLRFDVRTGSSSDDAVVRCRG